MHESPTPLWSVEEVKIIILDKILLNGRNSNQMLHTNSSNPLLLARDFPIIAKYTSVNEVTEIFNTQAAARYGNKRHCCTNQIKIKIIVCP